MLQPEDIFPYAGPQRVFERHAVRSATNLHRLFLPHGGTAWVLRCWSQRSTGNVAFGLKEMTSSGFGVTRGAFQSHSTNWG